MLITYTNYAEQKFDILNKHKIFFTKEQIEDIIKGDCIVGKKNEFFSVEKNGIKVLYKQYAGTYKVITFYPTKKQ